jgi:hypothetical protein
VLLTLACVGARRYWRKRIVLLDWDLTLDCLSTPGSKRVTREARDNIMKKIVMSRAQESGYMFTLRAFLCKLAQRTFEENILFLVVTRNNADNVRWMLENVVEMKPGAFKVISDTRKVYNKIELVLLFYPHSASGVWVLVDDSTDEHEDAAAYARENCPGMTLRHVRVKRPSKGDAYNYQYGMMNQKIAQEDFFWAINPWNLWG